MNDVLTALLAADAEGRNAASRQLDLFLANELGRMHGGPVPEWQTLQKELARRVRTDRSRELVAWMERIFTLVVLLLSGSTWSLEDVALVTGSTMAGVAFGVMNLTIARRAAERELLSVHPGQELWNLLRARLDAQIASIQRTATPLMFALIVCVAAVFQIEGADNLRVWVAAVFASSVLASGIRERYFILPRLRRIRVEIG